MRVGRHDKFALRARKAGTVVTLIKIFIAEVLRKQFGNQLCAGFAAGTEIHFDFAGLEIHRTLIVFLFACHTLLRCLCAFMSSIVEVGGACPFTRNHAGADRIFRCADGAERSAVGGMLLSA